MAAVVKKEEEKILSSEFLDEIKRVRELKGISQEEVSEKTNIKLSYVKAIESGNIENLPGGIYNRAYIRSVSEYLGINIKPFEKKVISDEFIDEQQIKVEFGSQFAAQAPRFPLLLLCFIFILSIYSVFYLFGSDSDNAQASLGKSDKIVNGEVISQTENHNYKKSPIKQLTDGYVGKDFTIAIIAKEQTQIELSDAEDNIVLSKIFLPNEALIYPADDKEYFLYTPEIGTLEVYLDGVLVNNLVELKKQEDKVLFTVDSLFSTINSTTNSEEANPETIIENADSKKDA